MDMPGSHVYVKRLRDEVRSDDALYYVLARNGLFLCRNHPLFSSCVPATDWPAELADHETSLELSFPRLRQADLERIVGFFAEVARRHHAEACVLLTWKRGSDRVLPYVPRQRAEVFESRSGPPTAETVRYRVPLLNPGFAIVGDVHSHVYGAARRSALDARDESYGAGLHVVVGRLDREPPEFEFNFAVDGVVFSIAAPALVIEGYEGRRHEFPAHWLEQVEVVRVERDARRHDRRDKAPAGGKN